MDMPCNCPLCGEVVELNDMVEAPIGNDEIPDGELICVECEYRMEEESKK
jgi:C4-type Zn-finger protein